MMLSYQFTEDVGEGFILSKANPSIIEGKFIQKNSYTSSQLSPLGGRIETQIIDYYIASFCMTNETHIGLELIDPPRTIRPFISRLYEMIGIGMIVKDSSVNPLSWSERIEKETECFWITEIQAGEIGISKDSFVRITASGSSDIREDFFGFLGEKKHEIQRVRMRVMSKDSPEKSCLIELKKNSGAKIYGNASQALYPLILNGLRAEIKSQTGSSR
jgi:hypothetical protein